MHEIGFSLALSNQSTSHLTKCALKLRFCPLSVLCLVFDIQENRTTHVDMLISLMKCFFVVVFFPFKPMHRLDARSTGWHICIIFSKAQQSAEDLANCTLFV